MTELPGLPGYEVRGQLGAGETGTVVCAWQARLERLCAVKELAPHLAKDPPFRERFREEARILATFDHPHIVRVYDYVEVNGTAYLVMECVEGASLAAVLRRAGRLTPEQSLGLLDGALEGLGHAHAAGILHRDLTPSNVLVDSRGVSKLSDFGLEGSGSGGTSAYCSPEQRRGLPLDPRSDIYSCGAIVYECLTGQSPARTGSDPRSGMGTLPAAVAGLVSRSMAEDPGQRPADTAALRAELESVAGEAYGPRWRQQAALGSAVSAAVAAGSGLTAALGGAGGVAGTAAAGAASEAGATVAGTVTTAPPPPAPVPGPFANGTDASHGSEPGPTQPGRQGHRLSSRRLLTAVGGVIAVIVAVVVVVIVTAGHHGTAPGPPNPAPSGSGSGSLSSTIAAAAGKTFVAQPLPAGTPALFGIACPTATICYAGGGTSTTGGEILTTTDGGRSWSMQPVAGTSYLDGVACTSADTCWAVGATQSGSGAVAVTRDGHTWSLQSVPSGTVQLASVTCPTQSDCLASGATTSLQSSVLATTDAGATWLARSLPTAMDAQAVDCTDAGHCWAAGVQGILATTDLGVSWRDVSPPLIYCPPSSTACSGANSSGFGGLGLALFGVRFTDPQHGFTVGGAQCGGQTTTQCLSAVFSTNNGGASWSRWQDAYINMFPDVQALDCAGSACIAVAQAFTHSVILSTTDGTHWRQNQTTPGQLWGVACAPGGGCIAVGRNGAAGLTYLARGP